jgi:hypothetical protein
MADGVGKIFRVRGDPATAITEYKKSFAGEQTMAVMTLMDGIRQRRSGISEASKGIDPKALQSTNQIGVDAIVTGAQERIELIARILAETGFKDLFRGLLREMVRNPNVKKTVQMRGKWIDVDPTLWDPNLTIKVNPTMGKGSDMNRLMTLQTIKDTQLLIIDKFGIANPMVSPDEFMNTITDMLALSNIKDVSRYFKPLTPEQIAAIQQAPKEPTPEELVAQATLEEVKAKTAGKIADNNMKSRQFAMDEDFRRDKLTLDTLSKIAVALAKVDMAEVNTAMPTIEKENHFG